MSIFVLGCSAPKPCGKKAKAFGNLDGVFNTKYNEYSPTFHNNKLYFSMMPVGKNKEAKVYYSNIKDTGFTFPKEALDLPLKKVKKYGTINFANYGNNEELFFAGSSPKSKSANSNIYYSTKRKNKWSTPLALNSINTKYYESYPTISKDGKMIIFSSDRPDGTGGIDLYYAKRIDDSTWSEPTNLGNKINTDKNEISAFLDEHNNLLFASKGHNALGGYDVFRANYLGNETWTEPIQMPSPINTEFDETGPAIYDENIYLASNRKDGCGARDLYFFQLCSDVQLAGIISDKDNSVYPNGFVRIYDEHRILIDSISISDDGAFQINLKGNKKYYVDYINECSPLFVPETEIITPCNSENFVKMNLTITLPYEPQNYDLGNFKIPFFISGYYKPITRENLRDLRYLFDMNLIGLADSTKYIEFPTNEYDEYSDVVEDAFNQITNKIEELVSSSNSKCTKPIKKQIYIDINGFADARGFSDIAKYAGEEISDELLPYEIYPGMNMDNELLSLLRAYFVQQYLLKEIRKIPNSQSILNSIEWQINAGGAIKSTDDYVLERKVSIKFGIK